MKAMEDKMENQESQVGGNRLTLSASLTFATDYVRLPTLSY